ncbi:hypothetical protein FACS1894126_2660 [Alphaproteobacteria bacterium]|nr:hypothetical protein FACS1894126_2660 [Alphaproteobacteria bacterium]
MPTLAELMQTRTAASMGAETSRITGDDVSTLNADPTKSLAPVSSWSSPAREEQNSSDETTGVRSYHGVPLYPPELVDQTGSHRIQDSLDHYTEWEPKLVEQIDHIIACLEWAPLAVRMRLLLLRKHTDEAKFERYKTEKSRSPLELRDHLPHVYITIDASPSQDVWKFTNDSGLDLLRVLGLLDTQPVGPPRGTITGCAYSITPAFAYLGGTRNHLAHGYGNCVDQLGNMWRGAFMNGKPYGRGILIRDGLCVYAGSLL